MIGMIFITLEKVVSAEFGEETWEKLLSAAGSDGIYHSLGNYDDAEVVRLVELAAQTLELTPAEVLRWFGQKAIVEFQAKWPEMFQRFNHVFDFVLSLNDIIHPHVRQLYPSAKVPHFNFVERTDNVLVIEYISDRGMCALAEGLTLGAAQTFDQTVVVSQPQCIHHGAEQCHIRIEITG